jgi:hypothetical protein
MVAGIFIPTLGCWKITGHYRGEELSYAVGGFQMSSFTGNIEAGIFPSRALLRFTI